MTEFSMLWETQTGTGDGAFSYTQDQSNDYFRYFDMTDPAEQGVALNAGGLDSLKVSGASMPLDVESGAALCWLRYWNDAATTVTVASPVLDTGGRVILETDWATNMTRLAIVLNTVGVTTIPPLVQTTGTTWQISLASFIIDSAGDVWSDVGKTISGPLDTRRFIIPPNASAVMKIREFTVPDILTGHGFGTPVIFDEIQQGFSHLRIDIQPALETSGGGTSQVEIEINNIVAGYVWVEMLKSGVLATTSTVVLPGSAKMEVGKGVVAGLGFSPLLGNGHIQVDIPFYSSVSEVGAATRYHLINSKSTNYNTLGTDPIQAYVYNGRVEDVTLDTVTKVSIYPDNLSFFAHGTKIILYGIK